MSPEISGEVDVVRVPYHLVETSWWGLVFEIKTKSESVSITAVETCAQGRSSQLAIYMRGGPLDRSSKTRDGWAKVGQGQLDVKSASRIRLDCPVFSPANSTTCLYLLADHDDGVAYAPGSPDPVTGGDEHIEIRPGFTVSNWWSGERGHKRHFNGRIAYS